MISMSLPHGRNATLAERDAFERYDDVHKIRETFVEVLREKFAHLDFV